jgi:hypothetical protein
MLRSSSKKSKSAFRFPLAQVVTAVLLSLISGHGQPLRPPSAESDPVVPKGSDERKAAEAAGAKQTSSLFAPSLETMERADFLLTPALLMQEAISEKVVITYPSQ